MNWIKNVTWLVWEFLKWRHAIEDTSENEDTITAGWKWYFSLSILQILLSS